MTSPRPRMIACDLDGTLLDSARRLSGRTRAAVARVHAAGWPFVVATARPVRDVRPIAAALGRPLIAVCGNGSVSFDFARHAVLQHRVLTETLARRAVCALRAVCAGVSFGAERYPDLILERGFRLDDEWCRDAVLVGGMEHVIDQRGFSKILVQLPGDAHSYLPLVRSGLARCGASDYEVTVSGSEFCEIMPGGVTKASALHAVAAALGFPPRDVVAFGDMPNDVAMLAWAGTAVAVANAHPDVLAVAHVVTESNDDDGVARYLDGLLSGLR